VVLTVADADAKELKALEVENAKLKKLLAEQMMDVSTLKVKWSGKFGQRTRVSFSAFSRTFSLTVTRAVPSTTTQCSDL